MAEFRRAPNEAPIVDVRTGLLTHGWKQWFQRLSDVQRELLAQDAAYILAQLLTVDGAGSTLDADLLDGQQGSAYQTVAGLLTGIQAVDGTGSGVDADLLDGQEGSYYRNADNINAGTLADARIASTIARDSEVTSAIAALSSVYLALSGGTLTGNLNGVTPTQLGYLTGLTSDVQTQLAAKLATAALGVPSWHVTRGGTNQTSVGTSATKIRWTTEVYDASGIFSHDADDSGGSTESRAVPNKAGRYIILASLSYLVASDGDELRTSLYKNGSLEKRALYEAGGAGRHYQPAVFPVYCNGTSDYLEIYGANGDSADTVAGDVEQTWWMGWWIGP